MTKKDLIEEFRNDEHLNADDFVARIMSIVNRYYQQATITDIQGTCPYGHCKGDQFKLTSMNCDGLCGAAYRPCTARL